VIILDTNVISEMMEESPAVQVSNWLDAQPLSNLFTTSVTQAEILYGIEILSHGRRRTALALAATGMFSEGFGDRILAFGADASRLFAEIAAARRSAGRPISQFDCQIAAIARLHDATLATRDIRDFRDCGLRLIDPWHH
jgi:predicted nucleic acid-binding protein